MRSTSAGLRRQNMTEETSKCHQGGGGGWSGIYRKHPYNPGCYQEPQWDTPGPSTRVGTLPDLAH